MGVKGQADNFLAMPSEGQQAFPHVDVPYFGCFIKGPGGDFITEGVVEGNAVHDVLVALEALQLLAGVGVPEAAGAIVRPRYKRSPVFVKGAIRQGLLVGLQPFEQFEFLVLVDHNLINQLLDQIHQIIFFGHWNQGFFI